MCACLCACVCVCVCVCVCTMVSCFFFLHLYTLTLSLGNMLPYDTVTVRGVWKIHCLSTEDEKVISSFFFFFFFFRHNPLYSQSCYLAHSNATGQRLCPCPKCTVTHFSSTQHYSTASTHAHTHTHTHTHTRTHTHTHLMEFGYCTNSPPPKKNICFFST